MRRKSYGLLFTARCISSLFAIAATILPVSAQAQIQKAVKTSPPGKVPKATRIWTPTRTPDGQPDFQGVWTNATLTPFERQAEFAGKATLTEQEAAAIEKRASENRVDRPPPQGDTGSYNQVFFDSGTTWLPTRQTSLVVEQPDGRVPIKPAAEAQRDYDLAHVADAPEHQTDWERCITRGVPAGMFPAGYDNAYQILQTPGYVVIFSEMIHEARVIPLDGRPHLPKGVRQWNGDSVGHWEGGTLVVDTTNYNGKGMIATAATTGRVRGVHESEALHVVERFKRVDADTISYEVIVDDPNMFTAPWKVSMPLTRDASYTIYEYACHEGNYAMEGILRAGREKEKAAERAAK
jgi:hypothetical protein